MLPGSPFAICIGYAFATCINKHFQKKVLVQKPFRNKLFRNLILYLFQVNVLMMYYCYLEVATQEGVGELGFSITFTKFKNFAKSI